MVRAPLYLATLVASRSNPVLGDVYQRLLANAKPPKLALVVLMRKMLSILNHAPHHHALAPTSRRSLTKTVAEQPTEINWLASCAIERAASATLSTRHAAPGRPT